MPDLIDETPDLDEDAFSEDGDSSGNQIQDFDDFPDQKDDKDTGDQGSSGQKEDESKQDNSGGDNRFDQARDLKDKYDKVKGLKDKLSGAKKAVEAGKSVGTLGEAAAPAVAPAAAPVAASATTAAGGATVAGGTVAAGGAAATSPAWVPVAAVVIVVVLFLIIVMVLILKMTGHLGGATTASAQGLNQSAPGAAIGVIDNYCQDAQPVCSPQLKSIIENAAGWANMPGAVLVVVGLTEYQPTFALSDAEIIQYSDPNGAGIEPCPVNPGEPDVNGEVATGPMQFKPATWSGNGYQYGNAAVEAGVRSSGYTGNICNILDAYYAAAKMLKTNSGIPFDQRVLPWSRDQFSAAIASYGSCSGPQDFDACIDTKYALYLSKANTVLGNGSIPTGWPTNGVNFQTPYSCSGCSHEHLSAVDITNGAPGVHVYATQNGTLEIGDSGDPTIDGYNPDGSPIFNQASLDACRTRTRYGCTGLYAAIRGDQYITLYMHLDRTAPLSPCLTLNGRNIKVGTYLGIMGTTGFSTGAHTHYEIRDLSSQELPNDPAVLDTVFPPEWKTNGATITTTYTGEACIQ